MSDVDIEPFKELEARERTRRRREKRRRQARSVHKIPADPFVERRRIERDNCAAFIERLDRDLIHGHDRKLMRSRYAKHYRSLRKEYGIREGLVYHTGKACDACNSLCMTRNMLQQPSEHPRTHDSSLRQQFYCPASKRILVMHPLCIRVLLGAHDLGVL